jgi:hypothetical protein
MTKKPKPKRKPRKRGPKEEYLRIDGDPAVALAKLLKPKK